MINGMTVAEFNARERHRASIVAKLHGYTPFDSGDTEESLKAEHLEITGELYRTREEEQAANVRDAEERRRERRDAQKQMEYDVIQTAKGNGFMDCREIRNALGWEGLKGDGTPYSPTGVAYRWIDDADEEVVYVLPEDGRRITSLTYRSGCNSSAFPRILEVKEAYYADMAAASQKSWDDAQARKDAYDKQKADELVELVARQEADRAQRAVEQAERYAQLDSERDAEIQRLTAQLEAEDVPHTDAEILEVVRTYPVDGPRNRKGYPKGQDLLVHAGFRITRQQKKRACQTLALEAEVG